jgi:pimeloyl-ACP methyl ester carboxylesterase
MRENPVLLVQSNGATLGVESCFNSDRLGEDVGLLTAAVAVACEVYGPLRFIGNYRPVFSCDTRGQTIRGSSVEDPELTIDKSNADFEAIREALGLEGMAMFGYSPGGFFATHYAVAHPERVKALVLVEPAVFSDQADLLERARLAESGAGAAAGRATLNYVSPELAEDVKASGGIEIAKAWQSPELMAKVFRLRAEAQLTEKDLSTLRGIPVLLIGGADSAMSFHIKRLAEILPEARVEWIEGANHLDLMYDERCSSEIATLVESFLRGLESREAIDVTATAERRPGLHVQ